MALFSSLSRELFDYEREETPGEILFFKLFELFIAYCTIQYAWAWAAYIERLSDVVLELGIAIYIDPSIFFSNGSSLVIAGLITVLVILGFFRVSKYAYLGAMLLLHLQFAVRFSQGEIPHSSNVVGMTLMGLAIGVYMFSNPIYRRRFTMGFTYFFIGLGYTMAAICKLIGTGIFWSDGRHLWIWIHEKAIDAFAYTGILDYNILQEISLSSAFFATTILTVGLLSEFFAWGMWWRKYRTIVILAVLGLHMGIYIVMNIMFWQTFFELILLAFPWAVWLDKGLQASTTLKTQEKLKQIGLRFA